MPGPARTAAATSSSSITPETRGSKLSLPIPKLRGKQVRLTDMMGIEVYDRDGSDLVDDGLFIDHGPWHFNVFELQAN